MKTNRHLTDQRVRQALARAIIAARHEARTNRFDDAYRRKGHPSFVLGFILSDLQYALQETHPK